MNRTFKTILAGASLVLLLASCVSYDVEYSGSVGEVADAGGLKFLVDPGANAVVAAAVRNDNPYEVTVHLRGVGGEIGYRYRNSGSGTFSTGSGYSTNRVYAAWLTSPSTLYLAPGEERIMVARLNNWELANKDFDSRIEFVIKSGESSARLTVPIDQDDVFEDASRMFTDSKLGRNHPGRYGAYNQSIGDLPPGYELTIPD